MSAAVSGSEPNGALRPLDFVLAGVACIPAGALAVFSVLIAPVFMKMFSDFGSELPALTKLAISPSIPLVTAASLVLIAWAPIALRMKPVARRLSSVAVLLIGVVACLAALIAMYLPIFALAGAVK